MRIKIFFFLLISFHFFVSAQDYETGVDSVIVGAGKNQLPADSLINKGITTSTALVKKKFSTQFQKKYKSKEFDYTTVKPHESLWERIKRNIQKFLEKILGKTNPNEINQHTNTLFKILGIIAFGAILYFILKLLIDKQGNFIFSKRNKKINIQPESLTENIHEINFSESIHNFEQSKDYRSAIRFQFLRMLKKLSDQNTIIWNPEKTNRDYQHEIKDQHLKNKFKSLNYIFENVWYGEFEIDQQTYFDFKTQFENIKN